MISSIVKPAKSSSSESDISNVSLYVPEAIFTTKMELKNSGEIENTMGGVELGLNRELNLSTSRLTTSQYARELSVLVTANEIELSVRLCMRVQCNFIGVELPGA